MRAFTLDDFGAAPTLRDDVPEPEPGPGELLVRVRASSVNPVDAAVAGGMLKDYAEHTFPVTLGRDFAGVVEATGDDVTGFAAGDAVFGFVPHGNPDVHAGSWADLIAVSAGALVAAQPAQLDAAASGAAPLVGATALLSVEALDLRPGERVLIVGATGGVGVLAVQLATQAGATVIAPGRAEDEEFLRGLGVSEVVERDGDVSGLEVDALIDLVSYTSDAYEAFAAALRDGGRAASPLSGIGEGPGRTPIFAVADPEVVARLGRAIDAGGVEVPIQRTYELADASDALRDLGGHKHGKLALRL